MLQTVNVPADSIKLRELQDSATPIIAQISGQAISSAIDSAINAGFSDNPPPVTPNGGGFSVQVPLDQPPVTTSRASARRSSAEVAATQLGSPSAARVGTGRAAMGRAASPTAGRVAMARRPARV